MNYDMSIPKEVFDDMFANPSTYTILSDRLTKKTKGQTGVVKAELDRVRSFLNVMGSYHMSGQAKVSLFCSGDRIYEGGIVATIRPVASKLQGEPLSRMIAAFQASDEVDIFSARCENAVRCIKYYDIRTTLYEFLSDKVRMEHRQNGCEKSDEEYVKMARDHEDTMVVWTASKAFGSDIKEIHEITGVPYDKVFKIMCSIEDERNRARMHWDES